MSFAKRDYLLVFFICFGGLFFGVVSCLYAEPSKIEETIEDQLKEISVMQLLNNLLNGEDAVTRVMSVNYVMDSGYTSFLDVGCGLCLEYYGFLNAGYAVKYSGIDISAALVENATSNGINCVHGTIENIEQADKSFDVVYARHVLEYLAYYQKALTEMLRVAKKAVVIIFSVKPDVYNDVINCVTLLGGPMYRNKYNKNKIEKFVREMANIKRFEFLNLYGAHGTVFETMLIIEKA